MSEQIVQIQNAETALAQGGLGFEGFTLKPATMKLVQRTTTDEGAQAGKLYDTVAKSHFDEIKVVPLAVKLQRVLFPPDGELGAEPICRSDDGIKPSENANVPQCGTCANCDHGPKMWKNWKASGKKPDCQEKFRLLFVLRDTGMPYYLTVGGSSISDFKKLREAMYRDMLSSKAKGEPRSIFDYSFTIRPVSKQGRKGNYFVLDFSNLAKITNPGEFGTHFQEFVMRQRANEADEASQEVDAEIGGESDSYQQV